MATPKVVVALGDEKRVESLLKLAGLSVNNMQGDTVALHIVKSDPDLPANRNPPRGVELPD